MNIHKKLMDVQSQLKAPKNQRNTFGNYNYRSCEDILEALKPLLKDNNLALTITDTIENVGDRYYIKACVKLTDAETAESIEVSALAREEESKKGMDASQITGSTSSYARKYALNGMFCIDDTKDADVTNTHGKDDKGNTRPPQNKPATGQNKPPENQFNSKASTEADSMLCADCGRPVNEAVKMFCEKKNYDNTYCVDCQKKHRPAKSA